MSKDQDLMAMAVDTPENRIQKAISIIVAYGGIDGAHHKDWVLDQAVRALTGCPPVEKATQDYKGVPYTYWEQTPSPEYTALIERACSGEDGPNTYSWELGIAP